MSSKCRKWELNLSCKLMVIINVSVVIFMELNKYQNLKNIISKNSRKEKKGVGKEIKGKNIRGQQECGSFIELYHSHHLIWVRKDLIFPLILH